MSPRYAVVLAMLLLCSCADNAGNNAAVIAKSTQEAEVAANRAEASVNAAEIAADRAERAAKKYDEQVGDAEDSERRASQVIDRLCTVCDSCSRGSGPALKRFWEYTKIQEAACSAPMPNPRGKTE